MAAGAAAGLGLSVVGTVLAAQAQKEAAEKEASLKRDQADELLSREAINEQILRDQSEDLTKDYGAAFAASGLGGSGIGGTLKLRSNLEQTLANSRRDAEFKARMLRAGADMQGQLASDVYTAGIITGAGTALTGGMSTFSTFGRQKQTSQGLYE